MAIYLHGRGDEQRRLGAFIDRVAKGQKVALFLGGQEGVGKSSLARWTSEEAGDRGFQVAYLHASNVLYPTLTALCLRLVAVIRRSSTQDVQTVEGAIADAEALLVFSRTLEELASQQAVFLVLDDADQLPQEWVNAVLESVRVQPHAVGLLVVARTIATQPGSRVPSPVSSDLRVEELLLEGLDRAAFEAFAADHLGRPVAPKTLDSLFRWSAGNPQVSLELLLHAMQQGYLREVGGIYVTTRPDDSLPSSLLESFASRIRSLTQNQQDILGMLALYDEPLTISNLAELIALGHVAEELIFLESQRFLRLEGEGVRLSHALYREAILLYLDRVRMAWLSAGLISWLSARRLSSASPPRTLIRQAESAGMTPHQAAALLLKAGKEAVELSHLQRAVNLLSHAESMGVEVSLKPELYRLLGESLENINPSRATTYYDKALLEAPHDPTLRTGRARALRKAGRFGESLTELTAAQNEGVESFEISRSIGVLTAILGDLDAAGRHFRRLLEQAKSPDEKAMAHGHLAQLLFLTGNEEEGHTLAETAMNQADSLLVRLHIANNLGWMKIVLGDWPQAYELLGTFEQAAAEAGDAYFRVALLTIQARLQAWIGEQSLSIETATRANLLARALGNKSDIIGALDCLVLSLLEAGRPGDALESAREISSLATDELEPREISLSFIIAGEAFLRAGHIPESLAAADTATSYVHLAPHLAIGIDRLRAEIAVRSGEPSRAIRTLEDALRRQPKFRIEAAAAYFVLARAYALTPDRVRAFDLAERAARSYEQLGARGRLHEVNRWLAANRPRKSGRKRTTGPGDLTLREVQILWLITTGKTNREIAGELVISEGTVNKHVDNIKMKLGVTRRTELVVAAARLGIGPDTPPPMYS